MSNKLQILHIFKTNLLEFFDELIYQYPKEADLYYMRLFLKDQVPIHDVMKVFIQSLENDNRAIRIMAEQKNDLFFLEHNIFDQLSKSTSDHFKKLWSSADITYEDKETIWAWVHRFIEISDHFQRTVM
jgi:hypothetical protein